MRAKSLRPQTQTVMFKIKRHQMKYFYLIAIFMFLISGCGSDTTNNETPIDNSLNNGVPKLYPIYTDPVLNYGSILSSENNSINLDYNFNSWLIFLLGGVDEEISLKVKQEIIPGQYDPSALWALFIRRNKPSIGRYHANEL